jgi:cellulose synthase/poly-beta-1,6-N-acetylglucosamine synthase-like glycosyltransferase
VRTTEYHTSAETPCRTRSEYRVQRFLELIPGFLVWGTFILPVVLFFFAPRVAGYVLSAYVVYWMGRYAEMAVRQVLEYLTLRRYRKIDWRGRLRRLEDPYSNILALSKKSYGLNYSDAEEVGALRTWAATSKGAPAPDEVYHLVIFTTHNENVEILEQSFDAVIAADYPKERIAVCLAFEERSKVWTEEMIEHLKARYEGEFGIFLTTKHPDGIPGEGRVKGANLTWAARHAREELHRRGIRDEQVIVSAFDSDTRAGREYFGVLAYKHLTNPYRDVDSYQPVLMYHNNIWDVPAISRVVAFFATYWTMIESTRPSRLRIFSSHAIGMKALVSVGYWTVKVIPDDSRQFWRMFFASDGRSRTVPLHTPVYMDAVLAGSYRATLREQYLQLRRWAYGIIDFPYIMEQNFRNESIPLRVKALQTLRQISQFHLWATVPLMLLMCPRLLGLLEPTLHGEGVAEALVVLGNGISTVVLPVGLCVAVTICLLTIPPCPPHRSPYQRIKFAAEWLLVPVILAAFMCWPAIDAQTRLIFRRYIGFRVTVKDRRSPAHEID